MTSLLLIACGRIPVIAFIVIFWCRRFVVIWRYIFDRKPTLFCSRPIFHAWMYFVNIEIVIFCIFTSPLSGPFKSVSFGHWRIQRGREWEGCIPTGMRQFLPVKNTGEMNVWQVVPTGSDFFLKMHKKHLASRLHQIPQGRGSLQRSPNP